MAISSISSPILIIGDLYVSKNNILSIKNKYEDSYSIVEVSASDKSMDYITSVSGTSDFLSQPKIIIIHDLPNQKAIRQSIIDLISVKSDRVKFIIWDSSSSIKLDPKTNLPNKTWSEFVERIRNIPDSKVINNGAEFSDKSDRNDEDVTEYIKNCFAKHKKTIDAEALKIFINVVGKERGLIISEVDKLCLSSNEKISAEFIMENAYPTAKEAVLYKFGNGLDGTYSQAILMLEQFLDLGINSNVLAEVMAKKARWQLAACHLYSKGLAWYDVDKSLVNMGKFPSVVWNSSSLSYDKKQAFSEKCETEDGLTEFITKVWGLSLDYFDFSPTTVKKPRKSKKDSGDGNEETEAKSKKSVLGKKEILPMPFMATQITSSLQSNFVKPNLEKMNQKEIRAKLLDRAIKVYLGAVEQLKEIRYGNNPNQCLYTMVRLITDRNLEKTI